MIRYITIQPAEMRSKFCELLVKYGMNEEKSDHCAEIFTSNSIDGVYTHGVNRFKKFIKYIQKGYVKANASPSLIKSIGAIEQWNGNYGAGVLNAVDATDRSIQLSNQSGIGCVALAHTNHWMRGGYYGWHAAKKGYVLIAWTNSIPSMPAWNALENKLGNNPFVIAVPFKEKAIVLDMALSQFSYGVMEIAKMKNEKLPVPGGYDRKGKVTDDPAEILSSEQALPIGYWKGSGLALLLDILATILSGGLSTMEISKTKIEYATQIFISIDINKIADHSFITRSILGIIDDYHNTKSKDGRKILYPGERVLETRKRSLEKGIPVAENIWNNILAL